jgi:hypothetical protein
MARTKLEIQFNGSPDFPLDLMLTYPRQFIRHVFKSAQEKFDVTDLCTADELNRNPAWSALVAAGTFSLVVTPGSDDVGDLTASKVAVAGSDGVSVPVVLRQAFVTGGAAGTADDVTVFNASAPYKFRIVDVWLVVADAEAASTVQLRTASGGLGSVLSAEIDTAALGIARQAGTGLTSTAIVAKNGSVYLRRSDRNVAGELFMLVIREA